MKSTLRQQRIDVDVDAEYTDDHFCISDQSASLVNLVYIYSLSIVGRMLKRYKGFEGVIADKIMFRIF